MAKTKVVPTRVPTVDPNEDKHAKFIRLANIRVRKAIKAIRQLGMLGTSTYEKSLEEVDRLEDALETELDKAFQLLRNVKKSPRDIENVL